MVCLEKHKVYTMPYNNPLLSQKIKKFLTSGDWFQSQRFLWAVPWCRSSVCIATKLKRESKVLWRGDRTTPVCFSPSVSNKPLKFWCIWSHASKVFSTPTFFKEQCIYRTTTNKQIAAAAAATRVHRLLCGWDPSRNLEWCFGLVEKAKTLLLHIPCFSCFCIIKHLPSVAPDNTSVSPWERASYVFVCNIYHLSPAWQIQNFFHTFLTLVSHSWCLLIHSRRRQRTTPPPVDDTEAK